MRTVLFVCVENTFRSVLSQAIFNSKAPQGWVAESAGVRAAARINPDTRWLLQELGIVPARWTPRKVTADIIGRASTVVTFSCLDGCPAGAAEKGEDWPVPGATGKSPDQLRAIRDDLSDRIDSLISRLTAST